ncbi:MAG: trypsin-like serine protease [Verrucomicrobiota bacterium]
MAALISAATGSTILDTVDPQLYRDEATLYPSVGKVTGGFMNGSGVMISDRWVLTAGHITDFRSGGTYRVGGVNYTIDQVIGHPQHTPAFSSTYDIGLLHLSSSVVGIQAATLWHGDSASLLGREATWVGDGLTGTGLDDTRGANEMRAFTNIIDGLTPAYGLPAPSFFADFDNPTGTSNSLVGAGSSAGATRLEGNLTAGDSGGGVFVTLNNVSYLVGIGSYAGGFSQGMNSRYGALSGAADLNYFHDWIFQHTGIAAVPEPSVGWMCALGCLLAARRKR